jgi:hypothetical protein
LSYRLIHQPKTMSETTDDDEMRFKNSKTTNIVAYFDTDADTARDVAVDIGGDKYAEEETDVTDHVIIGLGDEDRKLHKADYSDLPRGDTGDVRVSVERVTDTSFVYSTRDFVNGLAKDAVNDCLDVLADKTGMRSRFTSLQNSDWETKVRVSINEPNRMGLIHHKPNVEQGVVWEDKDADLMCFTITVKCKETSENTIALTDEVLVDHMVDWLNTQDWCWTARKRDCEIEKTERGDCYDVFN